MKSHRKPENEILDEKLREAAGELLDEELAAAGYADVDPALRERVMQAVRKQTRGHDLRRKFVRYGQIAAMLVLTAGVILFCIPTVRAGFVNAMVTWYDECFRVEFNPGTVKDDPDADPIVWKTGLTELPDGYVLTEQKNSGIGVWAVYQNPAGDPIMLSGTTDGAHILYDTGFTMTEIKVGEHPGYYMRHSDDTMTVVTWSEGRAVYTVTAYSPDISEDQLIRIAESLK